MASSNKVFPRLFPFHCEHTSMFFLIRLLKYIHWLGESILRPALSVPCFEALLLGMSWQVPPFQALAAHHRVQQQFRIQIKHETTVHVIQGGMQIESVLERP